jgi:sugar lactone lactonase YvrE
MKFHASFFSLICVALLSACGSGGNDAQTSNTNPPQISNNSTALNAASPAAVVVPDKTYIVQTLDLPRFDLPTSLAMDTNGFLFLSQVNSNAIEKINPNIPAVVSTYGGRYGFVDGLTTSAAFEYPFGVAVRSDGTVFVADSTNNQIRAISPAGYVTSYSSYTGKGYQDGPLSQAQFNDPYGLVFDQKGNLYVAENGGHRIRKITPDLIVSTVAGTGEPGSQNGDARVASFNRPSEMAVDAVGNIFVADTFNHQIRKISTDGQVSTFAGTGLIGLKNDTRLKAEFNEPRGLAFDSVGNLYVADAQNHVIRKISLNGQVSTFAGTGLTPPELVDGPATQASVYLPWGIVVDSQDNLYFTDVPVAGIRKISASQP